LRFHVHFKKKKQVLEQIAQMEKDLKEKQDQEIKAFDRHEERIHEPMASLSLYADHMDPKQPSKAQLKKVKRSVCSLKIAKKSCQIRRTT
jgi:hypothetical protein